MGKLAGGLNVAGDITLVKTSTLDEMSKKYGIPDLVKIDVEGDEYNVLLGGKYTINIGKTVFIIELHNDKQHQMVADILISSGYKLFDLKKNQIQKDIFTRHILAKKYD